MMRLPEFHYRAPRTIEEAAAWLADDPANAMLLAGGTDLLPNMKRRHQTPATLIGLRSIRELAQIRHGDGLTVGAGVTLSTLIADPRIRQSYAGLWQAAAQVATPHLRNMGTVGGNLCLDTRCTYYNQNYEWRKSIDFCLKKDGQTCWVARPARSAWRCRRPTPRRCFRHWARPLPWSLQTGCACCRSRTSLPTTACRTLPTSDQILTSIALPQSDGWRSSYWKLRRRGAFDFPVASAAVAARLDGNRVIDLRIVLGAVSSRPLSADRAAAYSTGED